MLYVKVDGNIVVATVATKNPGRLKDYFEDLPGEWLIDRPIDGMSSFVKKGDDIRMFKKDWSLRPLQELYDEGLLKLETWYDEDLDKHIITQKVEDGKIVPKTDYDFYADGTYTLPDFSYLDHEKKEVVSFDTAEEAHDAGYMSKEILGEHRKVSIREHRDYLIESVRWRFERYFSETRMGMKTTDNISELDAYVQKLRDIPKQPGFPFDIIWPEEP